jgi:hypothetical protein
MRINSRKVRKILGRIWTAPNRTFETFYTQEAPRCIGMNATLTSNQLHSRSTKMHRHECNTHIEPIYFYSENQIMIFSYTRFPVNKTNVEKFFKIMRKLLFNYFFYSHPEIEKFQGVTSVNESNCSIQILSVEASSLGEQQ